MSSGLGERTTKGRCFSYWEQYLECCRHVSRPIDCIVERDEYLHCIAPGSFAFEKELNDSLVALKLKFKSDFSKKDHDGH